MDVTFQFVRYLILIHHLVFGNSIFFVKTYLVLESYVFFVVVFVVVEEYSLPYDNPCLPAP